MKKGYPDWVCHHCGEKHRRAKHPCVFASTFHIGTCDVCEKITSVTEPRDYGYPDFPSDVR